jgi:hypothetical protein
MKVFSWLTFSLALCAFLFLVFRMPNVEAAPGPHPPVVVELFTSEGCSSCPPADGLLMELQKQSRPDAEIIVLSEHVDYWDYIGWKDPFSSRQFSDRQSVYAQAFGSDEVYTPQMVIDGAVGFTGSDSSRAAKEIGKAAGRNKDVLEVKAAEIPGAVVSVSASGGVLKSQHVAVIFAITEDDLESRVKRGENGGRILQHVGVVRALKEIRPDVSGAKAVFDLKGDWRKEKLHVIAFAQDASKRVIAAGSARID